MLLNGGRALQVARIGEFVEIDQRSAHKREPIEHEVRPDEAGAAVTRMGDRSLSITHVCAMESPIV
jgi:hypothetical protein